RTRSRSGSTRARRCGRSGLARPRPGTTRTRRSSSGSPPPSMPSCERGSSSSAASARTRAPARPRGTRSGSPSRATARAPRGGRSRSRRSQTMAREIRIGLLGVGWMGRLHSSSYLRVPAHYPECGGVARLVVAADEVESRARSAVAELGYERFTRDWRDVVADPEVDAVSIAAPNFLHREMALAAAAAGKPFWGEKPLGRFPDETAEVAAAAEAAGIVTIVGLNYRQAPAVKHARALIAGGALGEITHFRSQFVASYSANPRGALSWRFS